MSPSFACDLRPLINNDNNNNNNRYILYQFINNFNVIFLLWGLFPLHNYLFNLHVTHQLFIKCKCSTHTILFHLSDSYVRQTAQYVFVFGLWNSFGRCCETNNPIIELRPSTFTLMNVSSITTNRQYLSKPMNGCDVEGECYFIHLYISWRLHSQTYYSIKYLIILWF